MRAFGLTPAEWTAVAAIAQSIAAVGAVALLVSTWMSQRTAGRAIEESRRLSVQTEALVEASREGQFLAVKPVLECSGSEAGPFVVLENRGNGPLLSPQATLNGRDVPILVKNEESGEFRSTGALQVGQVAKILPHDSLDKPLNIRVNGTTMTGDHLECALLIDRLTQGEVYLMPHKRRASGPLA